MTENAPQLLILAVSLFAILCLSWFAERLRLGTGVRIKNAAQARRLAETAEIGFKPEAITVDQAGNGALLLDECGQVMLLRRHGARFAARMLDQYCEVRIDRNMMTITTPDRFFGTTTLDLGRAGPAWAASFRRLTEQG